MTLQQLKYIVTVAEKERLAKLQKACFFPNQALQKQ